jgi:hypothetical protein
VRSQEHAATVLADGMCAGRVIIPTHEDGLDIVRKRGDRPMISFRKRSRNSPQGIPVFLAGRHSRRTNGRERRALEIVMICQAAAPRLCDARLHEQQMPVRQARPGPMNLTRGIDK